MGEPAFPSRPDCPIPYVPRIKFNPINCFICNPCEPNSVIGLRQALQRFPEFRKAMRQRVQPAWKDV